MDEALRKVPMSFHYRDLAGRVNVVYLTAFNPDEPALTATHHRCDDEQMASVVDEAIRGFTRNLVAALRRSS